MKKNFLSAGFFGAWFFLTMLFVNIIYPYIIGIFGIRGFGLGIFFSAYICWIIFQQGKNVPLEISFLEKIQNFSGNLCYFLSAFLPFSLESGAMKKLNVFLFFLFITFFFDPLIATMHFKGRKLGDALRPEEDGSVFFLSVLVCNTLWFLRAKALISGTEMLVW